MRVCRELLRNKDTFFRNIATNKRNASGNHRELAFLFRDTKKPRFLGAFLLFEPVNKHMTIIVVESNFD